MLFTPDGRLLVCVGKGPNPRISVVDVQLGRVVHTLSVDHVASAKVWSRAMAARDGHTLYAGHMPRATNPALWAGVNASASACIVYAFACWYTCMCARGSELELPPPVAVACKVLDHAL